MSEAHVLEAVDALGYLHTVANVSTVNNRRGYVCTCGMWFSRSGYWKHLDDVGVPTVPPPPPITIDADTRRRAEHAALITHAAHADPTRVESGWGSAGGVLCPCGATFTTFTHWGDHLARAVLKAALDELAPTDPTN